MSRPPRLHVPGGCYHVILRGNHSEPLFASVADRGALNDIVANVLGVPLPHPRARILSNTGVHYCEHPR